MTISKTLLSLVDAVITYMLHYCTDKLIIVILRFLYAVASVHQTEHLSAAHILLRCYIKYQTALGTL